MDDSVFKASKVGEVTYTATFSHGRIYLNMSQADDYSMMDFRGDLEDLARFKPEWADAWFDVAHLILQGRNK